MASSKDALLRAELMPSLIRDGPPDGDIRRGVRGVEDDEVGVSRLVGVEGVATGPCDDEQEGVEGLDVDVTLEHR